MPYTVDSVDTWPTKSKSNVVVTLSPSTSSSPLEICEHNPSSHLDTEGDTCTPYRKCHLGRGCDESYDNFTASEMCCGCGGGHAPLCATHKSRLCRRSRKHVLVLPDSRCLRRTTRYIEFHRSRTLLWLWWRFPMVFKLSIHVPSTSFQCFDSNTNDNDASCSQHDQNSST